MPHVRFRDNGSRLTITIVSHAAYLSKHLMSYYIDREIDLEKARRDLYDLSTSEKTTIVLCVFTQGQDFRCITRYINRLLLVSFTSEPFQAYSIFNSLCYCYINAAAY